MISLVAKLINIFATTLHNILLLASFAGKLIVSVATWISSVTLSALQSIVLFFQIVYEDNVSIFTEDLPNSANGIYNAVLTQLANMQNGVIVETYFRVYTKINATITSLIWLVRAVFVMISEVLYLLKNAMIFMGDTVWLIVTFIPVHLPQLIRALFKNIANIIITLVVDSYMTLLKFTNYLTEVPLQSFMGITSVILIVRLCIHFRETILSQIWIWYWSIIRNFLYFYYVVYNYFTNSEDGMIRNIVGRDEVGTREVPLSPREADDGADTLCIICQERQKCVLTLPCRHVCLCTDCCRRLYGYQRTCPICRTFIYHSVTVYL